MNLQPNKHYNISGVLLARLSEARLYAVYGVSTVQSQEQQGKQQKPFAEPLLRLETELVQIDVVVVDKEGKLIRDLRREDFELYEDGKKQQISHFAAGTAAKPATWLTTEKKKPLNQNKVEAAEITAGRYIVLAVDDYHLSPENLLISKRALNKFIKEQMVGGDQVAVVTTSGNIGLFQQFTNERLVLERAIGRLNVQTRNSTSSFDVPRITDYQAELIDRGDSDAIDIAVQEILRLEPQPPPPPPGAGGRSAGRNPNSPEGAASPRERAIQQAISKARMIV